MVLLLGHTIWWESGVLSTGCPEDRHQ